MRFTFFTRFATLCVALCASATVIVASPPAGGVDVRSNPGALSRLERSPAVSHALRMSVTPIDARVGERISIRSVTACPKPPGRTNWSSAAVVLDFGYASGHAFYFVQGWAGPIGAGGRWTTSLHLAAMEGAHYGGKGPLGGHAVVLRRGWYYVGAACAGPGGANGRSYATYGSTYVFIAN